MVNIWPPKKCILPANIFEDFFAFNPWTLYIMKILKPFLKEFVLGPRKISTKMTGLHEVPWTAQCTIARGRKAEGNCALSCPRYRGA